MGELDLGKRLFALVDAYAALGNHRTGTATDRLTRDWLAAELEARGASVSMPSYAFSRYVADAELGAGGEEIQCLPLFYSGTGEVDTTGPRVSLLPMRYGLVPADLDRALDGLGPGEAAVLATEGSGGRLVAINRDPSRLGSFPAVLAAGRDLGALEAGPLRLRLHARVEPGTSANVVATLGGAADDPFVVTTPLTGWFRCAGERGTGLAIALEVACRLAAEHPVLFVGTTGHEIGHLGARAFRRENAELRPRVVLHLGASVAAADVAPDGGLHLSPFRFAVACALRAREAVEVALRPASLPLAAESASEWPGEGEEWRATGSPVLSFTGGFSAFHAPDDLPERVTSPALLAVTCEAVLAAARLLARG